MSPLLKVNLDLSSLGDVEFESVLLEDPSLLKTVQHSSHTPAWGTRCVRKTARVNGDQMWEITMVLDE